MMILCFETKMLYFIAFCNESAQSLTRTQNSQPPLQPRKVSRSLLQISLHIRPYYLQSLRGFSAHPISTSHSTNCPKGQPLPSCIGLIFKKSSTLILTLPSATRMAQKLKIGPVSHFRSITAPKFTVTATPPPRSQRNYRLFSGVSNTYSLPLPSSPTRILIISDSLVALSSISKSSLHFLTTRIHALLTTFAQSHLYHVHMDPRAHRHTRQWKCR